jgi:hypothetical protein
VSDVFKALADPTPRAILDELIDRDGQTLFELCTRLSMKHKVTSSCQAISQHLSTTPAANSPLDDTCGNLIQIAMAP